MQQSRTKTLVVSALIAALYVVLSVVPGVFNLASGAIQFRISEGLNHLVVFSRKYVFGVVLGVIVFNAIFSAMGWLDVVFGGGQSLIGLVIVAWLAPKLPNLWLKMGLNIVVMTLTMFLIAIEIVWTSHLNMGVAFWGIYGSLMLSEAVIMAVTAPIMAGLDRVLHFKKVIA
ncbi:QueT transporter family protein [Lacticaseibacillus sp. GG6-2]